MTFVGEKEATQKIIGLVSQFGTVTRNFETGEDTYRLGDTEVVTKLERTYQKSYRISSALAAVSGSTFRGCVDGVNFEKGGQPELSELLEKLTAESEQVQTEQRRKAAEEYRENYVPPVNRFTGRSI